MMGTFNRFVRPAIKAQYGAGLESDYDEKNIRSVYWCLGYNSAL
jgi:hypothetical protein